MNSCKQRQNLADTETVSSNLINSVSNNLRDKIEKLVHPKKLNGDFIKELQRLVSPKAEGQVASPLEFTKFQRNLGSYWLGDTGRRR